MQMTLSMYKASIPVFTRGFENLSAILKKADTQATEKKIDQLAFMHARLAPDMLPFPKQIQIASDVTKGSIARLAGIEVPSFADTEMTFAELQARIDKTTAFFKTVSEKQIDGTEDKAISLKVGGRDLTFTGQSYLLGFVIPNFYFHLSIAYAILRHNGVAIGKADFLGGA
jgi:hypothetical protein